MKKVFLLKLLAAVLIFQTIFVFSSKAQENDERAVGNKLINGKRIALVIGNADYEASVGKLKNPVNDAGDMANALKRLRFSLVGGKAQLNLNRRQMLEQIREFGSQIRQGGVGVFYFAGHGVQVDRRNYLIPITDSLQYQEDAEYEAVDVDAVLREMEYADNALNILILDACRNNALPKKTRSADKGLTRPREPSGVYIAFAARDGQTASENSSGRNGLYTQELLKNIETPNLRLEDIFIKTRVKVKELSKRTQEPIEYGSLDSEFYLNLRKNVVQPIANDKNNELVFWNAIENSNDIEDFENYLKRIASGEFKGIYKSIAELRIVKLKKSNISPTWVRFSAIANILLKYDFAEYFFEGLAKVKLNGNWGFVNEKGKETISLKYDSVESFSGGLATVELNGKWGFINKTGKEVIPIKYTFAKSFSENLAEVSLNYTSGFIDKDGRVVIPFKYDDASSFSEGLAAVRSNGKWGFIDKTGKKIISLKYEYVDSFSEGLAAVRLNGKFGFIDKIGKEIIPFKYEFAFSFSENLAAVQLNDKWGFIDKTGIEVISPKYSNVYLFSQGFAGVRLNNKLGFIDKTGREDIPLRYNEILTFVEDLAEVRLNDKWGFIDKTGKEVIPIKYDYVWCRTFRKEGLLGVVLNGKKGFVDIYGNEYFNF